MNGLVEALTAKDMADIAAFVYSRSGIRLTDAKRALVVARLQKRVRGGGFASFSDYIASVRRDPDGAECRAMIDALTTNKTSFFREPQHYEILRQIVVPALLAARRGSITGWSAGCATGEEAYSLAIVLAEATRRAPACRVEVLATDLSTVALTAAAAAVYPIERVGGIPHETLRRYFERGVGPDHGKVRVQTSIRRLVRFEHCNLLEGGVLARPRDFIWCRNTLMYFDHAARQRAIDGFEANLAPGGYFFMSHAENLTGIRHGMRQIAPAVYRKGQS